MNVFELFRQEIFKTLDHMVQQGLLPLTADRSKVAVEPPRDPEHADIATNAALVLAKEAGKSPQEIAVVLQHHLKGHPYIERCEVAGPGFVNLKLTPDFWQRQLPSILTQGPRYGDSTMGQGSRINVEYVSANPTGPMHIGHSRGAVFGDILASLLKKAGYDVVREFYINDAGLQTKQLARSAYHYYCEVLGQKVEKTGEYTGAYLIPVGQALAEKYKDQWLNQPETVWLETVRDFTVKAMMDLIRQDLDLIGIQHDVFTSERKLIVEGKVEEAREFLDKRGLVYGGILEPPKGHIEEDWEPRLQTLFRATRFGDDMDRPLKKSDGSWTYFASDIAYHYDKVQRGFSHLINVLGADHGGYVKRLQAATRALTDNKVTLEVKLCQMVRFMDKGQALKMSKRAGTFISMRDVVEKVGKDSLRFMMITRKNDAPLDFDFTKVLEQSKDNPVFYVQYAHARACSVKRHMQELFPNFEFAPERLAKASFELLTSEEEINLIKKLCEWPRQVEIAATVREPHRLAFYLYEVAAMFHALWTKGKENVSLRFIEPNNPALTFTRFALVWAMASVIASGLYIFGVQPVEEMR